MNKNLTELVFILDRSGSMSSMQAEAIGGFNSFLEEQKKVEGEAKLTVVLFDNQYELLCSGRDIKSCEPLTDKTFVPRGTTALLDAVGRTVDEVGKRLAATSEEERPGKVLVAILTDGLENASSDYKKIKINEMITHQKEKYSWEFIFLAANQDAIAEGMSLGIAPTLSMTYDACDAGFAKAFTAVSCSATAYRTTGVINNLSQSVDADTADKDVSDQK